MAILLPHETVHAKMLTETNDTFIYKGYIYKRYIREWIITSKDSHITRAFDSFEKIKIGQFGFKEETTSMDFYSKLPKAKKEFDFEEFWDSIKKIDDQLFEEIINLIIYSENIEL